MTRKDELYLHMNRNGKDNRRKYRLSPEARSQASIRFTKDENSSYLRIPSSNLSRWALILNFKYIAHYAYRKLQEFPHNYIQIPWKKRYVSRLT